MSNSLTPKQRAFCKYYVENERGNATEAARLAGYKNPQIQGAENLEKDNILSYINKLENKLIKQLSDNELHTTFRYDGLKLSWCFNFKHSNLLAATMDRKT